MSDPKYTYANNIQVLDVIDAIRKRPTMYVGSKFPISLDNPKVANYLLLQAIYPAIRSAREHETTSIFIELLPDRSAMVKDNGPGWELQLHPRFDIPLAELDLTQIFSVGMFDAPPGDALPAMVNVVITNALSSSFRFETIWKGEEAYAEYEKGRPYVAFCKDKYYGRKRGTKITLSLDSDIIRSKFNPYTLAERLDEVRPPGCKITICHRMTNSTAKIHLT